MKEKNKKMTSYYVDKDVLKKFDILTNKNSINKSKFIENALKEWINKNDKKQSTHS